MVQFCGETVENPPSRPRYGPSARGRIGPGNISLRGFSPCYFDPFCNLAIIQSFHYHEDASLALWALFSWERISITFRITELRYCGFTSLFQVQSGNKKFPKLSISASWLKFARAVSLFPRFFEFYLDFNLDSNCNHALRFLSSIPSHSVKLFRTSPESCTQ